MIDLHLHTTASDGELDPEQLVAAAAAATLRTIAIADHDTVAGIADATNHARRHGVTVIPGVEITAVIGERDVHVLGYFFDPADAALGSFLARQRESRLDRVREMAARLEALGKPIDVEHLLSDAGAGRSVGRPAVAAALVAAGHVRDADAAFSELIGEGAPAYVPRRGASPADVISAIHAAGGLASLAHPVVLHRDAVITEMAQEGLDAVEAYHSEHGAEAARRYVELARMLNLAVTGGSDYHGPRVSPAVRLGDVTLPAAAFDELVGRARARRAAVLPS